MKEAGLFRKLCSIVFDIDSMLMTIRLDKDTDSYLKYAGLSYDDLLVLDDYGLVTLGLRGERVEAGSILKYGRLKHEIEHFRFLGRVDFRANLLTRVGTDLFSITEYDTSPAYCDAVVKMFGAHLERLAPPT